ncbi:MAG: glycosyltransferase [Verrucomicrobiota bacterium]|nr:glycosyltransferase [Limisphaerales bacterium]
MADLFANRPRVWVDGKFFRRGAEKFLLKGVAYGPFAPNAKGEPFASPEQTGRDFALIRELRANLLRLYHIPPRWFLDLAAQHDLLLLIDIPWDKHLLFLDEAARRAAARQSVCHAVLACAQHPAVFAYSVANEIPADIVRWSGAARVADFIDELIGEAKRLDPHCLCTYTNFPSTEYLHPQTPDFLCFNLYLHQPQAFRSYLARLQLMADAKPLVLGEFGIDSLREGEPVKCETLAWQIEFAFRGGLAGAVVFSFTDDWYRGGAAITDWQMGLTTATRERKASFGVVQQMYRTAPRFALPRTPKVSVVVASFNGDRTLKACLESLRNLNYPDYEVILVDDGSTDTTPQLAERFRRGEISGEAFREESAPAADSPAGTSHQLVTSATGGKFCYYRHGTNLGLSVARNTGIAAATGEIVAFTDADCRVDADWLYYLVADLLASEFVAMGGPNLLPPEDSAVAAAVMVSPGGPAHVMLDDRQAEHIPGCNMAFFKTALTAVGGFDPMFRKAGDDVDLCWRLQQAGFKIGFSPAAFVWHYRRSTLGAYLKQQRGYGEAEALLVRKHPEYFNAFGDSVWRGRIYTPSKFGVLLRPPIIYRGLFGSAPFQSLYASEPALTLMLLTTLEYHILVTLPLWVLSFTFPGLLPLALASLLLSVGVAVAAGVQANLPKGKRRWWSRPLVALLFFLQPIFRGWERHQGRLSSQLRSEPVQETLDSVALRDDPGSLGEVRYWAERRIDRVALLAHVLRELNRRNWPNRSDIGWSEFDVEIYGNRWSHVQLITAAEDHPRGRQLICCQLRARWSWQAKVAFWALLGLEAMVVGFFGGWEWWLVLLVLTLPLFAYFLSRQKRKLQSLIVVFLDELAKESKLIKVPRGKAKTPSEKSIAKPDPIRIEMPKVAEPATTKAPEAAGKDACATQGAAQLQNFTRQ